MRTPTSAAARTNRANEKCRRLQHEFLSSTWAVHCVTRRRPWTAVDGRSLSANGGTYVSVALGALVPGSSEPQGVWGYGAGKPLERELPPARHLLSSSSWHGPEGPEWRLGAGPIAIDDIRSPGISLAFSLLSSPDVCQWVGCPCVVGWLEARLERDDSGWPVVETRGKRCRSTALRKGWYAWTKKKVRRHGSVRGKRCSLETASRGGTGGGHLASERGGNLRGVIK